jgi:PKD repeat protein
LTVKDNRNGLHTASVLVTVTQANAAPTAQNIPTATNEDNSVGVTLLGNDPEGAPLAYSIVTFPQQGGTLTGTGAIRTYTPKANFAGTDSFSYKVSDGQKESNVATVTITVRPVNDSPLARAVITPAIGAAPLVVSFDGRSSSDIEGAIATFSWSFGDGASASGPTASHTYAAGGSYSAILRVTDGQGATAQTARAISVSVAENREPTANNQSLPVNEDSPLVITLTGSDPEGAALRYEILAPPESGVLSGSAARWTYTPNDDFNGTDSFTFRVNDGTQDSDQATVSIRVSAVNDAPSAQMSAGPTAGVAPLVTVFSAAGSSDPEGPLTYQWAFGDGSTATGMTTSHSYTRPGTYTARLIVTDTDGATSSATRMIQALTHSAITMPAPDMSAVEGRTYQLGDEISVVYSGATTNFNWEVVPDAGDDTGADGLDAASIARAPVATAAPRFSLATLALSPGPHILRVQAVNDNQISPWAQARINLVSAGSANVKVYPNPWRAQRHRGPIVFSGVSVGGKVKILTVAGRLVRELTARSTIVEWDLMTDKGDRAASGLYLFTVATEGSGTVRGKLAVLR